MPPPISRTSYDVLADIDLAAASARTSSTSSTTASAATPCRRPTATFPAYFVTGILMLFLLAYGRRYFDGFVEQLPRRARRTSAPSPGRRRSAGAATCWSSSPTPIVNGVVVGLVCWWLGLPAAIAPRLRRRRVHGHPVDRRPRRRHPGRCCWRSAWRTGTGFVVVGVLVALQAGRGRGRAARRRCPDGTRRPDRRRRRRPARLRALRRRWRRVRRGARRHRSRRARRSSAGSAATSRRRRLVRLTTGSDHNSDCSRSVSLGCARAPRPPRGCA